MRRAVAGCAPVTTTPDPSADDGVHCEHGPDHRQAGWAADAAPKKVTEEAGLAAGEALSVEVTEDGVLLRKVDDDHDPSDWRYW